MKLWIVTDAWQPQVNGVVRTLTQIRDGMQERGWRVEMIGPSGPTMSCPSYPEIQLTLQPTQVIRRAMEQGLPDYIHIATEGPLGRAMRAICVQRRWNYTTSFHTRFPEYLKARFGIPRRWTYSYMRLFHNRSSCVLAPTASIRDELVERGFDTVRVWGRGVDTKLFHPSKRQPTNFRGPVLLYVGRLAIEKNIEAFLETPLTGTKLVVGDGPERDRLQRKFPDAVFLGAKFGEELATIYASSDVFVFPSLTDTFGLVNLEALSSGTPVAAFDAPGPRDIVGGTNAGRIGPDLKTSILEALKLKRDDCRALALNHSWENCVSIFESVLQSREWHRNVLKHNLLEAHRHAVELGLVCLLEEPFYDSSH